MIIGVDPGLTSGITLLTGDGRVLRAVLGGQLQPAELVDFITDELHALPDPVVVACESYMVGMETLRRSRQYDPLELIGVLRHLSRRRGWEFELQSPSSAKRLITDELLESLGLRARGRQHANDACRQALLYIARKHQLLFTGLLSAWYTIDTTKLSDRDKHDKDKTDGIR